MTSKFHEELLEIADRLDDVTKRADAPEVKEALQRLEEAATAVGKAWSGSALGYHARIYYQGLKPPPPGDHFSQEWGMQDSWPIAATTGNWVEYGPDEIERRIRASAGNPDLGPARRLAERADASFGSSKSEVLSILTTAGAEREDSFISSIREQVNQTAILSGSQVLSRWLPSGQLMSRDSLAVTQGRQSPPHLTVLAEVVALRQATTACERLAELARKAGSHIVRQQRAVTEASRPTGNDKKLRSPEFEKITLLWLVHYLPLKLWISACGIVIVVFGAGMQVGQIGLVREFLGTPSLPQATPIEPSVLRDRIDRLTEGYNKNVAQITTQILSEEQAAGKTFYNSEQQPHIDAANRLRALLDNEHKKYREAISELRGLQTPK